MLTLMKFGPAFGLSDPSPFVVKVELLLKMAGIAYREECGGAARRKAPKGKLPYIVDGSEVVADSFFIRRHLERRHGVDFDAGLSTEERAVGYAFERMVEDHLYWTMVGFRWLDSDNRKRMAAEFGGIIPPWIAPIAFPLIGRAIEKRLRAQGMGAHNRRERAALAREDMIAISDYLGEKAYLFGEEPKGADAAVGAFVIQAFVPALPTPLAGLLQERPNLASYRARLLERFYSA